MEIFLAIPCVSHFQTQISSCICTVCLWVCLFSIPDDQTKSGRELIFGKHTHLRRYQSWRGRGHEDIRISLCLSCFKMCVTPPEKEKRKAAQSDFVPGGVFSVLICTCWIKTRMTVIKTFEINATVSTMSLANIEFC